MKSILPRTLALTLLLPLAACSASNQPGAHSIAADKTAPATSSAGAESSASWLSGKVQAEIEQARRELASKNIDVNRIHIGDGDFRDSRPKAEITPQGELLIAGKQVAATPAQQALLLAYRQQITGIAEAGMEIGTQGANLGIHAASAALSGVFSGKSDAEIEAAVKPQADKIEAAALKLCQRLPALLAAQQNLAAAMPEFRPYANMEQKDVDDCGKEDRADADDK